MIGTRVISGPGWIRMVGVPPGLLTKLNQFVLQFVESRMFRAGMPAVLPMQNISRFLDTIVDMLADEVIAKGKGLTT